MKRASFTRPTRPFLFFLAVFTLAPSLQNRRISEASAMHERVREAREVRERSSRTHLAIRARLALASVRLKYAKNYARPAGY